MNKLWWFTIVCILSLAASAPVWAVEEDAAENVAEEVAAPTTIEELKSAITKVLDDRDVPAVGIALVDENGSVWIDAIGKANLAEDTDVDTDSMFRIGSTSKMFVGCQSSSLLKRAICLWTTS